MKKRNPNCPECGHKMTRHGKYASLNMRNGQRWKCWNCGNTIITPK